MTKITVSLLGLLGFLLVAAPGSAANPPAGAPSTLQPSAPVNGLATMNAFKLLSVTRGPDGANGLFQIDVAVENVSNAAKKLNLEAHARGGAVNTLLTNVDVAPKGVRHVVFSDPGGPPPACGLGARTYDVSVGETGSTPFIHHAVMHAGNCSFTAKIVNPWDLKTPDSVEAITSNSVYIQQVSVETRLRAWAR